MTKVFVLGRSGAGKTPVARLVAARLGVPHVPASSWVRRHFPDAPVDEAARQAQIAAMTAFSVAALKENPSACLDVVWSEHDQAVPCVVEGMRNPFDLIRSFDTRHDVVVFLERRDNPLSPTTFETGLDAIAAALRWLVDTGLADPGQVHSLTLRDDVTVEAAVDLAVADVVALVQGRFPPAPSSASSHAPTRRHRVHAPLSSLPLYVHKEVLYGGDPRFVGEVVPCRAFSFSAYPGSAPTLQVLLEDGAVFSYLAPPVLRWREQVTGPVLDLDDLVYHPCPDGDVVVSCFPALDVELLCFFKRRDLWLRARYGFTVDWYEGNDMLHFVQLENGQVAFLPHHKIKFGGDAAPGFQPYKKLRNTWQLASSSSSKPPSSSMP